MAALVLVLVVCIMNVFMVVRLSVVLMGMLMLIVGMATHFASPPHLIVSLQYSVGKIYLQ
jgi:hypothetical protein